MAVQGLQGNGNNLDSQWDNGVVAFGGYSLSCFKGIHSFWGVLALTVLAFRECWIGVVFSESNPDSI